MHGSSINDIKESLLIFPVYDITLFKKFLSVRNTYSVIYGQNDTTFKFCFKINKGKFYFKINTRGNFQTQKVTNSGNCYDLMIWAHETLLHCFCGCLTISIKKL